MPKTEYHYFYSHILGRNIQFEITGHYGYPVLMFPTSGGSFVQNRDFGLNASVEWFVNQGKIKLYNIETIDNMSFYNKGLNPHKKIENYDRYHSFLTQEFIPYLQKENHTHRIAVAGASFGGYHAADVAFRYPDLVSHLFSLSGAFNIRNFCPIANEKVYFHCPNEFMPNEENWKYNHMKIVLGTSNWDICLSKNKEMSDILNSKGISHWYDEKKWQPHDWSLWNSTFPEYIGAYFS